MLVSVLINLELNKLMNFQHPGILMAVTNTIATLPGITVPIFVGKLITKDVSNFEMILEF
jgi:hypothetical protein